MTTRRRRAGSVAWLREMYRWLNKEFFKNRLPQRFPIAWADLPGTIIARVKWSRIRPNDFKPRVMQFDRRLKGQHLQKQVGMSMLHEMAHLKLGVDIDCREWDGKFDKEMFRLAKAGAFRYFW